MTRLRTTVRDALGPDAPPETLAAVAETLAAAANPTPIYVRLLVGAGAWFAALFLTGFLAFALDLEETGLAVASLLLVAVATVSSRVVTRSDFLEQTAMACSFAGQLGVLIGVGSAVDEVFATAIIMLALELVLVVAYAEPLHRFVSTCGAWGALAAIAAELAAPLLGDAVAVAAAGTAAALFYARAGELSERLGAARVPGAWGSIAAAFGWLVISAVADPGDFIGASWVTTVTLAVALLAFEVRVLTGLGLPALSAGALGAALGTVLLAGLTASAPGVIASVAGLCLAFHVRDDRLVGLTAAFVLTFTGLWYYSLEMTLLDKSMILAAAGVVLLGLRFLLARLPGSGVDGVTP